MKPVVLFNVPGGEKSAPAPELAKSTPAGDKPLMLFTSPESAAELGDLAKSHVEQYVKKDGTVVGAHDDKRQKKAAPAASGGKSGGYSVKPFKHGGHQIQEPDGSHHVILQDEGVAKRHADALNHVEKAGKSGDMDKAVADAAKKHLGHDSLEEVGNDREDFADTGKVGLKRALHAAYNAGAGGDHPALRAHRDAIASEAAKHFTGFDTLDEAGSDREDFQESSKGLIKHALKHAYAHGAKMAGALKKPEPKKAAPKKDEQAGGGDERISSDDAFDKLKAAGASNVSTTSGHINYAHKKTGSAKLAHREEKDGSRTVSKRELDDHLAKINA